MLHKTNDPLSSTPTYLQGFVFRGMCWQWFWPMKSYLAVACPTNTDLSMGLCDELEVNTSHSSVWGARQLVLFLMEDASCDKVALDKRFLAPPPLQLYLIFFVRYSMFSIGSCKKTLMLTTRESSKQFLDLNFLQSHIPFYKASWWLKRKPWEPGQHSGFQIWLKSP